MNNDMVPEFLRPYKVGSARRIRELREVSSNWMKLHAYITAQRQTLPRKDFVKLLGELLWVELTGECRSHMLTRIKRRFNAELREYTDREIMNVILKSENDRSAN